MDHERHELYVEGLRDKTFLDWLVPPSGRLRVTVVPIEQIDIPDVRTGGNRQRLVKFMHEVWDKCPRIRALMDSDASSLALQSLRLASFTPPPSTWITDFRDLESYVLDQGRVRDCLQLGYGKDGAVADTLYTSMIATARRVAALRLVSEGLAIRLPVSAYRWIRHVSFDSSGEIGFETATVITSLLQSAGTSLSRKDEILEMVNKVHSELRLLDDREVIHGKDALTLLTRQFKALGIDTPDVSPTLWATFRQEDVAAFPVLAEVVAFLRR
jgi:hypothetical protein